ncbi:MAG: DUF4445 domain-containing protein [Gemmatimonadetes bacterium]|jgi:uncharacterized 2Fe-2S/4Fe-4S cluster protein (DUF4445 family)|nr:DUF4445 domain-containing protein [Gemmatimonadota bacterium]MBT5144244.1 DUF4445 domain-containing protein [Gemmatimonadota bacterium]MBT5588730.1 DUF4445 domain-containing protein [Gemmatimonadota bacterium]MBT5964552.1 DUF4445 domain-containing protein [Gemmatimonadota bacterium]MBT6629009.1 DUF4445 domain-containing protein [Gemmatimonadota bacterium]
MSDVLCGDDQAPLTTGRTLFDFADDLTAQVPTSCLRNGYCHECVVSVEEGSESLSAPTDAESFLKPPYRLACQARIVDDALDVRFTPLRRTPQILSSSPPRVIDLDPVVTLDGDRVLYDAEPVDTFRGHVLGLAIDLGTTTIVMDLVDLLTGESLAIAAFENPQRFGGSDIMNRISYDGGPHKGELQKAVTTAINQHISRLGEELGFRRQEIYEITIAGNSTMRDLFFRLDVQPIGTRPYKSTIEEAFRNGELPTTALLERSRRLGVRANIHTRVYGLPLIASHVGADTAADLVAIDLLEAPQDQVVMLVDVGTNTEVIIAGHGRMLAASSPAGPAFEGGLVLHGMPGYEGAIESVTIDAEGAFQCGVIGDCDPVGICGSGLVDLLAELRRSELMSERGVIGDGLTRNQSILLDKTHNISFSSEDASHLAQAKAANYCGQQLLMRQFGVDASAIDRLFLAGGFANYIDVSNAMDIGFIAPVAKDRVTKIGNAALQGAREVLLDRRRRRKLEETVTTIEHVELETDPTFFDSFVDGCMFQPMIP